VTKAGREWNEEWNRMQNNPTTNDNTNHTYKNINFILSLLNTRVASVLRVRSTDGAMAAFIDLTSEENILDEDAENSGELYLDLCDTSSDQGYGYLKKKKIKMEICDQEKTMLLVSWMMPVKAVILKCNMRHLSTMEIRIWYILTLLNPFSQ
jgi:hypothetical protein